MKIPDRKSLEPQPAAAEIGKSTVGSWPDTAKKLHGQMSVSLAKPIERRDVLKGFLTGVGGLVAASTGVAAVKESTTWQKFFQDHYKALSAEDKAQVFERIENETQNKYGATVHVKDPSPLEGVKFAYALNLSRCNGSRRCVEACVKENNQSRDPQIQYIKVVELDIGTFNLEKGDLYYEGESVPRPGKFYLPIQCHQCDNAPCTKVCPVEATWKEKDGIVVIDYDWCIGCRYCMASCPYEARRFNFATPQIPSDEINPNQSYLSNRIRPRGVVEKCHFCLHRTREGMNPACLEACPTGSRKFGNILDPQSEVSIILKTKRVFVLKEELNTIPSFFYYFD